MIAGYEDIVLAQLVLNENSRRGREAGAELREALRSAGIEFVESELSDAPASGVDCIIGAGGDGTVAACVAKAVEWKVPLGVIPLGTFNELARTLAIPLDVGGAVDVIARGKLRSVDVGSVNGRYFTNEASIGISSRIARIQTPELKQRFGFLAIFGTALQAFRQSRPMHVELRYDGKSERLRTIQLTVANSHRFGGFLEVADAAIDDGRLDLYSVDIRKFREAFAIAWAMLRGKRRAVPGLRTFRAARFEVRTSHPHHIAADAEPAGATPAVFEVLPKALSVFAAE